MRFLLVSNVSWDESLIFMGETDFVNTVTSA